MASRMVSSYKGQFFRKIKPIMEPNNKLIQQCRVLTVVCDSLTQSPFFVLCPSSEFFREHDVSVAGSVFVFRNVMFF